MKWGGAEGQGRCLYDVVVVESARNVAAKLRLKSEARPDDLIRAWLRLRQI